MYAQVVAFFNNGLRKRHIAHKHSLGHGASIGFPHRLDLENVGGKDFPGFALNQQKTLLFIDQEVHFILNRIFVHVIEDHVPPYFGLAGFWLGLLPTGDHVCNDNLPPASEEHKFTTAAAGGVEKHAQSLEYGKGTGIGFDKIAAGKTGLVTAARFAFRQGTVPAFGLVINLQVPFNEFLDIIGCVHVKFIHFSHVLEIPDTVAVETDVFVVADTVFETGPVIIECVNPIAVLRDVNGPFIKLGCHFSRGHSHNFGAFGQIVDEFRIRKLLLDFSADPHYFLHIIGPDEIFINLDFG